MKKLYILVLITFCSFLTKAQYTLTSAMAPVIGEVEKIWSADTTGISNYATSTGTGQTWVYSMIAISPTATAKSTTYSAKSAAPNSSSFGGGSATIAKSSDGVEYEIQETTSTGVFTYGKSNPTLTIVYQDAQRLATLPFQFATFSTDTYSSSYTSGTVSVTRTGTVSTLGDATGTLYLPNSLTYSNCLRIKLSISEVEVWPTYSTTLTAVGFVYFNSASKWGLLTVLSFSAQNSFTSTVVKGRSVEVNDAAIYAGIKEQDNDASNFSLYPNPAANSANLWFVLTDNESYEMNITNSLGQVVRNQSYNDMKPGAYNLEVDLKELPAGIYYVKLKGTTQEGVKKLIIE
jgi:hypothetical protein